MFAQLMYYFEMGLLDFGWIKKNYRKQPHFLK